MTCLVLNIYLFLLGLEEKKHTYMAQVETVIPTRRMLCAGELEAIQMQWSKQAYISQNNIEPTNTSSISQQPACPPLQLPQLGI